MKYAKIIEKLTNRQKAELLVGRDFWSTAAIEEAGIPSAFLSDGPHGIRKQVEDADHLGLNTSVPATCFPTAAGMANSWNVALGEKLGEALGEEAVAQKVNVLLGPGTNIKRNPLCGRNFEYFSEDPYLAGKMASAYVRGIQSKGISACIKHFALNSQEKNRMISNSIADERAIREIYLPAFEMAVKEGNVQTLMSSYNKINGTYANENTHLLKEILRDEWGFNGIVVTDWGACNDRIDGLKAGNELEMPTCRYSIEDIFNALEDGSLSVDLVDESLDRLIDLFIRTNEILTGSHAEADFDAHHALARKCAEECMVLLKNDSDLLPLNHSEKVCFIGDFAQNPRIQGAGSSIVNPAGSETFFELIGHYDLNYAGFSAGFNRFGKIDAELEADAAALAEKCDTIVFFAGLDELSEAEGIDRKNMKLPENQINLFKELKKTGKKIVTIFFCGSPVELDVLEESDAILHAYLGGQAAPSALLNILTGRVCPSGKLAETYPYKYEDCATSGLYHADDHNAEYRESIYVGYRYYDSAHVDVRYPFGFGLSYTTFEYGNLSCSPDGVSLTVKNTRKCAGAEIVQMYISKKSEKVFRPEKELKGFSKVFLNPGQEKEVFIPFDEYSFRVFNPAADCWQVESGEYKILIGSSSRDIQLTASINIEGNASDFGYGSGLSKYFSADVKSVTKEDFEDLLRYAIEDAPLKFINKAKTRIEVDSGTTVTELKYSVNTLVRVFSKNVYRRIRYYRETGQNEKANVDEMFLTHMPVRSMAKIANMTNREYKEILQFFNTDTREIPEQLQKLYNMLIH